MESDNAAAVTASSSTGALVDNDSTFASDKTFLSQKLGDSLKKVVY